MSLPSVSSTVEKSQKEALTKQYSVRNSNVAVTRTYLQRLGVTVRVSHVFHTWPVAIRSWLKCHDVLRQY